MERTFWPTLNRDWPRFRGVSPIQVCRVPEIILHFAPDRITIIDLGPIDGRVEERIEFLGAHDMNMGGKIIIE